MGIRQIVLAGNSGRNLAFGPTLQTASDWGDVMMSGHRDTHFSFMKSLKKDELLRFTTTQGTREYRVSWLEVIDTRHQELVLEPQVDRLTLTTCYPFDTVTAGGPLRYVVTARPVNAGSG
jgi:sortase A